MLFTLDLSPFRSLLCCLTTKYGLPLKQNSFLRCLVLRSPRMLAYDYKKDSYVVTSSILYTFIILLLNRQIEFKKLLNKSPLDFWHRLFV